MIQKQDRVAEGKLMQQTDRTILKLGKALELLQ
jgi:hypothetical protein